MHAFSLGGFYQVINLDCGTPTIPALAVEVILSGLKLAGFA
jgi:hypothetical protein